jgi:DNA-directed RNA polymerase subunit M/transcription elongation factor TFIIS
MKFCDHCENMMYVNVNPEKKLVHLCKTCNNQEIHETNNSLLIINTNKIDDEIKYSQYINKYLKYDPTLPRVNNIACPNTKCTKNADENNEVIYIKYNTNDMKYLYHCCYCNEFWKTN